MTTANEVTDLTADPGQTWAVRWLESNGKVTSPEGRRCAELIHFVFDGIYHRSDQVLKATWDDFYVKLNLTGDLSTWDFNYLTRLVVGAHDRAIRVEISPANAQYLRVMMHPRQREGSTFQRHPTMEDAIQIARKGSW